MAYVSSGTCSSNGLSVISSATECEKAANALLLQDTDAFETQSNDRPVGCIYELDHPWLVFADPSGHPNPNVDCGSLNHQSLKYDCICSGKMLDSKKTNYAFEILFFFRRYLYIPCN